MLKDHDYTTGNLLDFWYHQNYYKLTGIDLSRQTNTSICQQINFMGTLKYWNIKNYKILNGANDSKFVIRKWNTVNDNSKANYNIGNEITYNTKVLKSKLYDYNDTYILVKGDITVTGAP